MAAADTASVDEDGTVLIDVRANDTDVDGDVVAEFCNHALANTMARKRKKV